MADKQTEKKGPGIFEFIVLGIVAVALIIVVNKCSDISEEYSETEPPPTMSKELARTILDVHGYVCEPQIDRVEWTGFTGGFTVACGEMYRYKIRYDKNRGEWTANPR